MKRKLDLWIYLCYTQTQADRATVSLQLFHACKLHNCSTDVLETLLRQIGAGDVLDVGAQVDTRVLLSVSVGGCATVSV